MALVSDLWPLCLDFSARCPGPLLTCFSYRLKTELEELEGQSQRSPEAQNDKGEVGTW
jgi:hypothetical protein